MKINNLAIGFDEPEIHQKISNITDLPTLETIVVGVANDMIIHDMKVLGDGIHYVKIIATFPNATLWLGSDFRFDVNSTATWKWYLAHVAKVGDEMYDYILGTNAYRNERSARKLPITVLASISRLHEVIRIEKLIDLSDDHYTVHSTHSGSLKF